MAKENNLTDFLTDVASAIKDKRGIGSVNAQNFSTEIRAIEPLLDTLEINDNGNFNVKDYKNVSVLVQSDDFNTLKNLLEGNLKTLYVPYGVTKVIGSLFPGIGSKTDRIQLENIYLPSTITHLGTSFYSETKIYYEGDLESWLRIQKGSPNSSSLVSFESCFSYYYVKGFVINNVNTLDMEQIIVPRTFSSLVGGAFNAISLSKDKFTKVFIPNTISQMGSNVFEGLKNVDELEFENDFYIEVLPRHTFRYYNYNYTNYSKVILPKCKIFEDECFNNANINELIIQEGLEEIKKNAFTQAKIKQINLPSTLKILRQYAFNGVELTSVKIPSSVTLIEDSAFNRATTKIVIESTEPFTIQNGAFHPNSPIYVPKGTSQTFKSATNWSKYNIYEEYAIVLNVPSSLVNNETITYSIDGGKTYQQFTNSVLSINEVAIVKIKSTDSSQVVKVGTSAGASDVGTISNSELTFSFTTDTNVYLTIQ